MIEELTTPEINEKYKELYLLDKKIVRLQRQRDHLFDSIRDIIYDELEESSNNHLEK